MSIQEIDIRTLKKIPSKIRGKYTHKIAKGTLPDSSTIWYDKEMENPRIARLEVLAQEFFRLIIPNQPQTRIAKNPTTNTYHILSEEVPGYRDLPFNQQAEFTKGTYFGLGQICFVAAFLQEIDLKRGNICLNNENQVIKIDGDWCFAAIRARSYSSEPKALSAELLSKLPYLHGMYAHNWLDIIEEEITYSDSHLIEPALSSAPHFRNEVNQAILKTLLLPNNYIKRFVDTFIPVGSDADRFITFLQQRREELKAIALKDASFKAYLLSQEAKNDVHDHLLHMKGFVVHGVQPIIQPTEHDELENNYAKLVAELGILPDTPIQKPLITFYGSFSSGNYYEDTNTGILFVETGNSFKFINKLGKSVSLTKAHQAMMLKEVHAYQMLMMQKRHASEQALTTIQNMKVYFDDLNLGMDINLRCDKAIELIEQQRKFIDNPLDQQIIRIIEAKKVELREAAKNRIIQVALAEREMRLTAESIRNIPVSFIEQYTLKDVSEHRQLLLKQVQELIETPKITDAHKKLNLSSRAINIQIAFTNKQHQINQSADAQIIAIQQNRKINELIRKTANAINNIQVNFASINNLEELNHYQKILLSQVDDLMQNENIIQTHQNLPLYELHPDLRDASARKRQEINQQARILNERFNILAEIHFDDHLGEFIKKATEMSDKAISNSYYEHAAQKTKEFCDSLKQAKKEFLHQKTPLTQAKIKLKNDCELAILHLRPEVKEHREWSGAIAKFLLDLLSLLTFGLVKSQLSLFARTDTTKKLDQFNESTMNTLSTISG